MRKLWIISVWVIGAFLAHADSANWMNEFGVDQVEKIRQITAEKKIHLDPSRKQFLQLIETRKYADAAQIDRNAWPKVQDPAINLMFEDLYGLSYCTTQMTPEMSDLYVRDIAGSIPESSLFLGATDAGRFLMTAYQQTGKKTFVVLTQNQLSNDAYCEGLLALNRAPGIALPLEGDFVSSKISGYAENSSKQKLVIGPGVSIDYRTKKVNTETSQAAFQYVGMRGDFFLRKNYEEKARRGGKFPEVYIEEPFTIPWRMDAYLIPHELIFKVSLGKSVGLTSETIEKNKIFWDNYERKLLGNQTFLKDNAARAAFARLRVSIARFYAMRKQFSAAEYAFRQALRLDPKNGQAYLFLSMALLEQNRFDEAREAVSNAAKVDPNFPQQTCRQMMRQIVEKQRSATK